MSVFWGQTARGKTTTMRVLTCFLPATEGTARIAGYDIFDNPLEVKKRIGYLPELPPLYRDMRVRTYLEFIATIKGVAQKKPDSELMKSSCNADLWIAPNNSSVIYPKDIGSG